MKEGHERLGSCLFFMSQRDCLNPIIMVLPACKGLLPGEWLAVESLILRQ
jgi:hypothetical protein